MIGIAAGACMASALAIGWLAFQYMPPAPTTVITASPQPTTRPTQPPCKDESGFLQEAECLARRHGEVEQAIAMLALRLDELETDPELAHAYRLLVDAETYLYHYQLAAGYLERLYEIEPTVENINQLAEIYYLGADHEHALERYLELLEWEGSEADQYREVASARIDDISEIIGTPAPKE